MIGLRQCLSDIDGYYIVGAALKHLPTDFNSDVNRCTASGKPRLLKCVEEDFPGWIYPLPESGEYKILMQIPCSFFSSYRFDGTLSSLLKASEKTIAYLIDIDLVYYDDERIGEAHDINVLLHFTKDGNLFTPSCEDAAVSDSIDKVDTREQEEVAKLNEIFGVYYKANKDNPEVVSRLRRLISK